jgi:hypothetical protein
MSDIIRVKNQNWYDCWIYNIITSDLIILPQTPVNFSENYTANFANQEIIGSSRPIVMYTGTSLRTINFSLQNLSQSYLPAGYDSLTDYVHAIQSLEFPEYSDTGVVKAPTCKLQLGNRSFIGVVNSVNVNWGDEVYNRNYGQDTIGIRESYGEYDNDYNAYRITNGERIRCNIDISFTNTRKSGEIPGATEIRDNG